MRNETLQKFNGRIVKVGDQAIAHMRVGRCMADSPKTLDDFVGIVPVVCRRIADDRPCWQPVPDFGPDVSVGIELRSMSFVNTKATLTLNQWTWEEASK